MKRVLSRLAAWFGALERAEHPQVATVPLRNRLLIALAAGAVGYGLALFYLDRPGHYADFYYPWYAARLILAGKSPYLAIPGHRAHPFDDPFSYPLPTPLGIIPLTPFPYYVAGAIFFGLSSALLAFGITRDGYYRLPLFLSASYVSAASHAQWSPFIMATALLPSLGFLAVLKPNLGLAITAYRPTLRAMLGGAALLVASLLVLPAWPVQWLHNLGTLDLHYPPLRTPGGFLLLLALLRWRWPEARLLLAMACVPQLIFWNDQLPLWLIPRTLRESLLLSILSAVGAMLWKGLLSPGERYLPAAAPYVMAFLYLPALIMVLRRPSRPGSEVVAPEAAAVVPSAERAAAPASGLVP